MLASIVEASMRRNCLVLLFLFLFIFHLVNNLYLFYIYLPIAKFSGNIYIVRVFRVDTVIPAWNYIIDTAFSNLLFVCLLVFLCIFLY